MSKHKHTHSKRTGISLHDHKCLKTCLPSSLALPTAYCVLRQEHLFDLKSKVKNHTCTCTYPKQIIPCFVTKSESITLDLQKVYLPTRIIKMSKCVQFRSCKLLLHIYFYQMTSIWEYTEQLVWFFKYHSTRKLYNLHNLPPVLTFGVGFLCPTTEQKQHASLCNRLT